MGTRQNLSFSLLLRPLVREGPDERKRTRGARMIRGLAQRGGNYPKRGDTRRDGGRGNSAGIKDTRGRRISCLRPQATNPQRKNMRQFSPLNTTPSLLTKLSRGGEGGRSGGRREVTLSGIIKRMLARSLPVLKGLWLVGWCGVL